MRLELNLPALERLIGGDTEIELHLRQQIVQEFAKRHIKEIAATATYEAAIAAAKQFVNEAAKEAFDVENVATSHLWPTVGYRLKSIMEKMVTDSAQKIVDEELRKYIEYQKRYWAKEVESTVKKAMAAEIEKAVSEGIKQRLEAASKAV